MKELSDLAKGQGRMTRVDAHTLGGLGDGRIHFTSRSSIQDRDILQLRKRSMEGDLAARGEYGRISPYEISQETSILEQ